MFVKSLKYIYISGKPKIFGPSFSILVLVFLYNKNKSLGMHMARMEMENLLKL